MGFCHGKWLRRNSDVLGHSSGYWDWVAVFTHSFQVQFYRATDQLGSFHERGPSSHATGQVGHVGAVASRCFFVDDRVLHRLTADRRWVLGLASVGGLGLTRTATPHHLQFLIIFHPCCSFHQFHHLGRHDAFHQSLHFRDIDIAGVPSSISRTERCNVVCSPIND